MFVKIRLYLWHFCKTYTNFQNCGNFHMWSFKQQLELLMPKGRKVFITNSNTNQILRIIICNKNIQYVGWPGKLEIIRRTGTQHGSPAWTTVGQRIIPPHFQIGLKVICGAGARPATIQNFTPECPQLFVISRLNLPQNFTPVLHFGHFPALFSISTPWRFIKAFNLST